MLADFHDRTVSLPAANTWAQEGNVKIMNSFMYSRSDGLRGVLTSRDVSLEHNFFDTSYYFPTRQGVEAILWHCRARAPKSDEVYYGK